MYWGIQSHKTELIDVCCRKYSINTIAIPQKIGVSIIPGILFITLEQFHWNRNFEAVGPYILSETIMVINV
jgi:hypothetical protein